MFLNHVVQATIGSLHKKTVEKFQTAPVMMRVIYRKTQLGCVGQVTTNFTLCLAISLNVILFHNLQISQAT